MDLDLRKIWVGKDPPKKARITDYDKTSRKRPAWIQIKGLPPKTSFISIRINQKLQRYMAYLGARTNLYLPIDHTKEELKKHYDKYSKIYDWHVIKNNRPAIKFILEKLKIPKDAKILDLGAGTGIASEEIVKKGHNNVTLVDYSKGMLEKARQKKILRQCKFKCQDISKLNLKEKFDFIISIFSLASDSYFNEKEMQKIWRRIRAHLKNGGTLAIFDYDYEPPKEYFRKIDSGTFHMQWYIGKRI